MSTIPVFGTRVPGKAYVYRPSAYALVRNAQGKFAVARTPVACYLLGGGMDPGETAQQTIVREAKEECGLVLDRIRCLGRAIEICFSHEENEYFEKDCFFIEAKEVGRVPPIELDHELLWLSADEAIRILTHGSHRWAVQTLSERRSF